MASPKHVRLAAGIVLTVVLGHWAALSLLQSLWRDTPLLRPLATPMFTRLLVPTQPPPPPAVHEAPAPARVQRPLSAAVPRVADKKKAAADSSAQTAAAPAPPASAASAASSAASAPAAEPAATPAPEPSVAAATATTSTTGAGLASSPADATPTVAGTSPATTGTVSASTASTTASATAPSVASVTPTATASATGTTTVSAAAAAPASAPLASKDLWPADTRLNYRLTGYYRGELTGDARVQWQRTGEQYQVRIEVEVGYLKILTMTSQGVVTPQGLMPRAYEEQLRSRRRNATLGEQQITLEQGRQVARPAGVQDTASQFVELAFQFASGRAALQAGRNIQFWMARPGAVDLWTYDMIEEATLHTPRLGPVRAIHLKPRPIANPRGNITAQMWFAPSLQYLPVRIRIDVGEGSYVDLLVDQIEQR